MPRMHICPVCHKYQSVRFNALVNHIRFIHSNDPHFSIKCGVGSCEKVYKKLDSFLQHVRRFHNTIESVESLSVTENEANHDLQDVENLNVSNNDQQVAASEGVCAKEKLNLEYTVGMLVLKLRENNQIPQIHVNSVLSEFKWLFLQTQNDKTRRLAETLRKYNLSSEQLSEVTKILSEDELPSVLSHFSSEHNHPVQISLKPWPDVFPIPEEAMPQNLLATLKAGLFPKDRQGKQLVQVMFDKMCEYTKFPTKEQYAQVARTLVQKYPCLGQTALPVGNSYEKATNKVAAAAAGRDAFLQVRLPDDALIFTAEIQALKMALELIETSHDRQFIVFTDSLSSLLALQGHEEKHPCVMSLREIHSNLVRLQKSVVLAWVPSHVGIHGNEKADTLAKEALQMDITNLQVPHTDYRPNINGYVKSKWQELWDSLPQNKLYQVKPTVGTVGNATPRKRRDDLVLTRARIGHTYLTHAYLLHGEERPYYDGGGAKYLTGWLKGLPTADSHYCRNTPTYQNKKFLYPGITLNLHREYSEAVAAAGVRAASYNLRRDVMDTLIRQLPTPFLLLGDFNADSDVGLY
ncbi:hypothetical protein HOLleu_10590 [Holothuria leucospilota]|uniref:RNase H type-1 domain-containing protein n=1 Tax=Holothuria leucospilota TaxID=206669 RepID=A0A9Q1HFU1_HOLLE|nr:hypothetical protein HOLleu_10590 [Holothuria leucospilota]